MKKSEFKIKQAPQKYTAFFGFDIFAELVSYLKKIKFHSRYVIITDSVVKKIYGEKLLLTLRKNNFDAMLISFKHGELSKTRKTKEMIEDKMAESFCDRNTIILALGGGVVGDIAGFVSATYMRGIRFIQIPTTILACVDSCYGGKTGVDTEFGKNLIGAYNNPIAIFIDLNLMKTLDNRNYVNGIVEGIKHALIKDKTFFEFIKKNIDTIKERKSQASSDYEKVMEEFFFKNIEIKKDVVEKDFKETNYRKILNYGHTFGHAIETLSKYRLLHGEAIAIGLCVEAYISHRSGYLSKEDFIEHINIIKKIGLKTNIPKNILTKDIIEKITVDKKSLKKTPHFILLKSIGEVEKINGDEVSIPIDLFTLFGLIESYGNEKY